MLSEQSNIFVFVFFESKMVLPLTRTPQKPNFIARGNIKEKSVPEIGQSATSDIN